VAQAIEGLLFPSLLVWKLSPAAMNQVLTNQLTVSIVLCFRHVYLDVPHIVSERRRIFDAQRDVGMWQAAVLEFHSAQVVRATTIPFTYCVQNAFQF
jgi:hypothetical protein